MAPIRANAIEMSSGTSQLRDDKKTFLNVLALEKCARQNDPTVALVLSGSLALIQKSRGGEMQMITRRVNEGLVIGNDIHVTVLDISRDNVRLAISSPNNTPSYWEQTLYWEDAEQETAEELLIQ
jgi:carbon storage regulator CsrA